jgi:hypothetical protein
MVVIFLSLRGWVSSFGEMYKVIAGRAVEDLLAVEGATVIKLSDGIGLRFSRVRVDFGKDRQIAQGSLTTPVPEKHRHGALYI